MSETTSQPEAKVRVPQHVVYRSFPTETVVLNLQTGKYHGLNATAGRMLEAMEKAPSIREAAKLIAAHYELSQQQIETDMCQLCEVLRLRGLIEIDGGPAS